MGGRANDSLKIAHFNVTSYLIPFSIFFPHNTQPQLNPSVLHFNFLSGWKGLSILEVVMSVKKQTFLFFFLIIATQFIKEKKQITYFDAVMLSLPKV